MTRTRVAIVAVVVTAALGIAAVVVIPHAANPPILVTAQFEDVVGLYEGNAVSVLGMPVGRVDRIETRGSYVEVTLEIDHGVDIPADAQAVTVSTSILTDRHVELTPPYRGGPKLRNRDVVGLNRTRSPVDFDRTLKMLDKLAAALRGDGQGGGPVADLVTIGADVASRNGRDIKDTLDQLSEALRLSEDHGTRTKESIQSIVTNLAELTQVAADNDATIRGFGSNLLQLTDILADQDLGTGSTGAKINQILEQATALLEKNRDGMKSTIADAATLTTAISDNRRELSEAFNLLPLTAENIYNAIDPNAGSLRVHLLADKLLFNTQFAKELCNLIGDKQLGCATGTIQDYGPDFGITGMLDLMAGVR